MKYILAIIIGILLGASLISYKNYQTSKESNIRLWESITSRPMTVDINKALRSGGLVMDGE